MQKNLYENLRKKVFLFHQKNIYKLHHKLIYIDSSFYELHSQSGSNQFIINPKPKYLRFPNYFQNHRYIIQFDYELNQISYNYG